MTEWTTIRVRQDAKDKAEERKPEGMTWSEFIASKEHDPEINTPIVDVDIAAIANATANEVESRLR